MPPVVDVSRLITTPRSDWIVVPLSGFYWTFGHLGTLRGDPSVLSERDRPGLLEAVLQLLAMACHQRTSVQHGQA